MGAVVEYISFTSVYDGSNKKQDFDPVHIGYWFVDSFGKIIFCFRLNSWSVFFLSNFILNLNWGYVVVIPEASVYVVFFIVIDDDAGSSCGFDCNSVFTIFINPCL